MSTFAVLHALIHSLSKAEKRHFSLTVRQSRKQQADYWQLYLLLEQQPEPDIGAIEKHFQRRSPEPARKYLYQLLIKCLRNLDAGQSVDSQLSNLLQESRILLDRGLTDACQHTLHRIKELAFRYEKFTYVLLAIRLEQRLLTQTQFHNLTEQALVQRHQELSQVVAHEQNFVQHSQLYEVLLHRYWHRNLWQNSREAQYLNDLVLQEYQLLTTLPYPSFESQKLHLHFQSQYFLMSGDYESSLRTFHELIQLFENHRSVWADTPVYFLYVVDGMLADLRASEQYAEMTYFIRYLQSDLFQTAGLRDLAESLAFCHRMHQAMGQQETTMLLEIMAVREKQLARKSVAIPANIHVETQFLQARAYFQNRHYNRALTLVNPVINEAADNIPAHWLSLYYMLRLLIHQGLGNFDYLDYELKSFSRRLKKQSQEPGLARILLEVIQALDRSRKQRSTKLPAIPWEQASHFEKQLLRLLPLPGHTPAADNDFGFA
jgi:hypothetical protein